jgi:hypothetical protein
MRFRNDESGQMIVMLAVSMTALMAFMALAVDVGVLFHVRREVQIAADAAAAAGALDYHYNPSGSTARAAALAAASQNGVTNGSNGTVAVTFPTSTSYGSPYTTGFVQAIVTVPNPTMFMRLFGMTSVNLVSERRGRAGCKPGVRLDSWRFGDRYQWIGGHECYWLRDLRQLEQRPCARSDRGRQHFGKASGGYGRFQRNGQTDTDYGDGSGERSARSLAAPGIPGGGCTRSFTSCNPSNPTRGNMNVFPNSYTSISGNSGGGTMTLSPGNYTITGNFSATQIAQSRFWLRSVYRRRQSCPHGIGFCHGIGRHLLSRRWRSLALPMADGSCISGSGRVNLIAPTSGGPITESSSFNREATAPQ